MTHQEAVDTLASERYLLDDMPGKERLAFEDHFFSCETCAGDLRSAATMLEGAKSGFATRSAARVLSMPAKAEAVARRTWYRSAALPWAAAATLACVTVYQSIRVGPALRQDASPIAIAPVVLHPAARGAEPVVALDPDARMVSVALDVNDSPEGAALAYDLATADGRPIATGRAAAPAPGSPLLLLLSSSTLTAPMHYVIALRDAGAPARLLAEYRFALSPR